MRGDREEDEEGRKSRDKKVNKKGKFLIGWKRQDDLYLMVVIKEMVKECGHIWIDGGNLYWIM